MKPNIIFIMCDSMDGRIMGCMGHPAMAKATLNLDRLANKGVLFMNAYSNSPLCVPSRASVWSGMYVHKCEAWNNFKGLDEDYPTFETHLEKAGYTIKIYGKRDHLSGRHSERARVSAWRRTPNKIILRPTHSVNPPKIIYKKLEKVHRKDWADIHQAIKWLRSTNVKKPFYLYIGLRTPHPPYITSEEYLKNIDLNKVDVPPLDQTQHPILRYLRSFWIQRFEPSEENIRLLRAVYFAMIAEVDRMVGKILDCIDDLGLSDTTYIIFTSDHGEHAMEHGLTHKHTLYEPSIRVPLIVSGPNIRNGSRIEKLVSLIDLYPTILELASIPAYPGLDGWSLVPLLREGVDEERSAWVFSEYHGEASPTSSFMVRNGKWKYIVHVGMPPQLFNLEKDPWEIENLASDCTNVAKEMEKLLKSIVDYEKIYWRVEEYNKKSFKDWRSHHKVQGDYYKLMSKIFSGWNNISEDEIKPWSEKEEKIIEEWLKSL